MVILPCWLKTPSWFSGDLDLSSPPTPGKSGEDGVVWECLPVQDFSFRLKESEVWLHAAGAWVLLSFCISVPVSDRAQFYIESSFTKKELLISQHTSMCLCVHTHVYTSTRGGQKKVSDFRAGVACSCELFDMGTEDWTPFSLHGLQTPLTIEPSLQHWIYEAIVGSPLLVRGKKPTTYHGVIYG